MTYAASLINTPLKPGVNETEPHITYHMKSLYLSACLLVPFWPALGAENPARPASPSAGGSAGEKEKPFSDPFASEGQPAKAQPKIKDPLQPMNRAFFHFNDKLYLWGAKTGGQGL